MANYEATRYDWDGQYLTSVEGVNTGVIVPWGSASIPSGFLECNGQAVSQATYAALFAVIGTTYGNPGGGNFNVPDLTDRTVVNKSNTKSLAQTGGANTVTPTGNVCASLGNTTLSIAQIPSHSHTFQAAGGGMCGAGFGTQGGVMCVQSNPASTQAGSDQGHGHNITSPGFTGSSLSVLQPYLTLTYIIKT
jgi:microcystin-dependent protein